MGVYFNYAIEICGNLEIKALKMIIKILYVINMLLLILSFRKLACIYYIINRCFRGR